MNRDRRIGGAVIVGGRTKFEIAVVDDVIGVSSLIFADTAIRKTKNQTKDDEGKRKRKLTRLGGVAGGRRRRRRRRRRTLAASVGVDCRRRRRGAREAEEAPLLDDDDDGRLFVLDVLGVVLVGRRLLRRRRRRRLLFGGGALALGLGGVAGAGRVARRLVAELEAEPVDERGGKDIFFKTIIIIH